MAESITESSFITMIETLSPFAFPGIVMAGLPIIGIEMPTICILGIVTPSSSVFPSIMTPGLLIVGIETPTIYILGIVTPNSFISRVL